MSAAEILYDFRLTVTTVDERPAELRPADLDTTGTCTDVYTARIGDGIKADFGELGSVRLALN